MTTSIQVVAPASSHALTSKEDVIVELGSPALGGPQETAIERLILEASSLLSREADKQFVQERVIERVSSFGSQYLTLTRTPVTVIHSVKFQEEGAALDASEYSLHSPESGSLFTRFGWRSTQNRHGDIGSFPADTATPSWIVEYTAGYVTAALATVDDPQTLPYEVERACIDLTRTWFQRFGSDPGLSSEKIGRAARNFVGSGNGSSPNPGRGAYPPSVQSVIRLYQQTVLL